MFIYRVKASNGQTILVQSETELTQDDINEGLQIYEQRLQSQEQVDQPQIETQDQPLSKRLADWYMGAKDRQEKRRETFDKVMNNSLTKSLIFQTPAIAAGALFPASLPIRMGTQALLSGGGAYLDKLTNDETVGDSASTGLATGAISAGLEALPPALKYTGKGAGAVGAKVLPESVRNLVGRGYQGAKNLAGKGVEAGKEFIPKVPEKLLGFGLKLPDEGVERVIQNPNIVTESPKDFGIIANQLNNQINQLKDTASKKFEDTVTNLIETNKIKKYIPTEEVTKRSPLEKLMGLKNKAKINPQGKEVIQDVEFENIGEGIQKLKDIDFNKLITVYHNTQKTSATPVTGAFYKLVNNKPMTIPDTLEVNRFISALERNKGIAQIPNMAIDKLSKIKSLMKKNIEDSDMPLELKEAWNQYRIDLQPINQMENLGLIDKKTGEVGIENVNRFITKTIDSIKSPQKQRANPLIDAMEQLQTNLGQTPTYGSEFLDEAVKNIRQKQGTTGVTNLSEMGVILAQSKPIQMGAGALTGGAIGGSLGAGLGAVLPFGLAYLRNPDNLRKLAQKSQAIRKGESSWTPSMPQGLSSAINKTAQNVRQAKDSTSKTFKEIMEDKSGTLKPTLKVLTARTAGGQLTDNEHKKILRERGLIK